MWFLPKENVEEPDSSRTQFYGSRGDGHISEKELDMVDPVLGTVI